MKNKKLLIYLVLLAVLCAVIYRANKDTDDNNTAGSDNSDINHGKSLALKYCQSCHMLPEPSLLDKENWPKALAMMAPRLGIFSHNNQAYQVYPDVDKGFYPSEPVMSSSDWQDIIDYYLTSAPSVLPSVKRAKPIKSELPFFSVITPPRSFYRKGNTASLVEFDLSVKPRRLFVNDGITNKLFLVNEKLKTTDSLDFQGTIVDIYFDGKDFIACKIGRNVMGNNLKLGTLTRLQINPQGNMQSAQQPFVETLARPVQVTSADLNRDGEKDYLVAEFGNFKGSLSWLESQGTGKYLRRDIRPVAGATKAILQDYNRDGLPDIWVLFAQGEEGIFLLTNKGNGTFDSKQVVRFPPSYGSNSFELNDFNHDGFPDILATCGDRGDGIDQLKPYHGVYIFMNNGKNAFSQEYFFPINGCIKAMARDFDKDGDFDIAAIGLYGDSGHPEEGFVYLNNKGKFNFEAYSLPSETKFRSASTMDVADLDGDGKQDIVLGHGITYPKDANEAKPLFIVLKNRF
jgi:hypothetical protein